VAGWRLDEEEAKSRWLTRPKLVEGAEAFIGPAELVRRDHSGEQAARRAGDRYNTKQRFPVWLTGGPDELTQRPDFQLNFELLFNIANGVRKISNFSCW
jgi:hypothetical protein